MDLRTPVVVVTNTDSFLSHRGSAGASCPPITKLRMISGYLNSFSLATNDGSRTLFPLHQVEDGVLSAAEPISKIK